MIVPLSLPVSWAPCFAPKVVVALDPFPITPSESGTIAESPKAEGRGIGIRGRCLGYKPLYEKF